MNKAVFYIVLFIVHFCSAQNLVINPSFEEYWDCPTQISNTTDCKYVYNPQCVIEPTPCLSTSDYFNSCAPMSSNVNIPNASPGYQTALSGNAFLGIGNRDTTGYREYIQIKLSSALLMGNNYPFSFAVNLANNSHVSTYAIGVKFVEDSLIYTNNYLWEFMQADWENDSGNYITDTTNWTRLKGDYDAFGGEKWMIIGIFHPVKKIPVIVVNENAPPAWKHFCYFYIDDVEVLAEPLQIPNVFTPNNDGANDLWLPNGNVKEVKIINRWGNEVYSWDLNFTGWDGRTNQGALCAEGVYFYRLTAINPINNSEQEYTGFIHLVR